MPQVGVKVVIRAFEQQRAVHSVEHITVLINTGFSSDTCLTLQELILLLGQ